MFDVPPQKKCSLRWQVDVPIDDAPWQVGLIVGPSGSGKSSVMRHMFGETPELTWGAPSVIDDFSRDLTVEQIAGVCQAVGFNTIPAWMRPHAVLSNGEKFRVELARRMLEGGDLVAVDEFTSVVDRQVAQIGSHAVQKHVRKHPGKKFVAVTCHYDVLEWLQPDWVLDMATVSFQRRLLQRRPPMECVVGRLPYAAWRVFAPFHYMSSALHKAARCFGLWANGDLAAFVATLHQPHPETDDIQRVSRAVTLPDWQGIGLNMALVDTIGSAYRATGKRLRHYPAHPALIRSIDRSPRWRLEKRAGTFQNSTRASGKSTLSSGSMGSRPCAVFEYCGEAMPRADAERLLAGA